VTATASVGHHPTSADVVATARFSGHTAADGQAAWIVSDGPHRVFSRNRAITMVETLTLGYSIDRPHVAALRWEPP
jgi:hypothetical protein